mgnify:CR=1 FL=1
MKLPAKFMEKMLKLLGEQEYGQLISALSGERVYGLRINRLKISIEDFLKISPFDLEAVPWADDGFYISGEDAPGRHPYYHAGLYYIQEPSAMLPGQVLGAGPGDRVLDMCAAPGGKTVQIAAAMKGRGLLVSNDINAERVKALVKNIELCGIRNAIVLNESPENLARSFRGFFDKILIDAPCSGEGMFRKDETAARSWESFKCERCAKMQEEILHWADQLLKPGGTLVYSTCTFSPEENEQMIIEFITSHEGYELADIPKFAGIEGGRPEWAVDGGNIVNAGNTGVLENVGNAENSGCVADAQNPGNIDNGGSAKNANDPGYDILKRTARLWPHRVRGEGHFVAKMVKKRTPCPPRPSSGPDFSGDPGSRCNSGCTKKAAAFRDTNTFGYPGSLETFAFEDTIAYEMLPGAFRKFVEENMNYFPDGVFLLKGRHLYQLPEPPPSLAGLKTAKFGWFLGTIEGDRFEPSHSLVMALDKTAFKRTLDLKAESAEVLSYLKGETLMLKGEKGLTAVCVDGKTLGWAKQTGEMLKNLYPKGWRKMK